MEIEKQIFVDCFNFLKQNIEVRQDQEYWLSIAQQTTEIEQKYKGNKFAVAMLKACTDILCDRYDEDLVK